MITNDNFYFNKDDDDDDGTTKWGEPRKGETEIRNDSKIYKCVSDDASQRNMRRGKPDQKSGVFTSALVSEKETLLYVDHLLIACSSLFLFQK